MKFLLNEQKGHQKQETIWRTNEICNFYFKLLDLINEILASKWGTCYLNGVHLYNALFHHEIMDINIFFLSQNHTCINDSLNCLGDVV